MMVPLLKRGKGFALLPLLVFLSMGITGAIYLQKQYQWRQAIQLNKQTVQYVEYLMPVLYTHFKTECYANFGIVAASFDLQDLIDADYLSNTYPSEPQGTMTFSYDRTGVVTYINVSFVFDDQTTSTEVARLSTLYIANRVGLSVTWKASVTSFSNIDSNIENMWHTSNNGMCK